MQTRRESLVESFANVASGFLIGWAVTVTVLPLFGMHPSMREGFQITAIYTLASIIRGYLWRRHFNKIVVRRNAREKF